MSDNYSHATEEVKRFFVRVSAEADDINAKINVYADRMGRITKQGDPAEFDAVIKGSADDLELFARRLDELLPDYRRNLELLTKGFVEHNESLNPATDVGGQESEGMRRESQKLAETATGVKAKVTTLRGIFAILRDKNYDHRLTQSTHRVIATIDDLFTAYEDLETFALKVSFSADQK
jgi:hypothetical protein